MIILITGSTHTGKTNLAQKLLEKYKYPYLSQDHLKMGLIRTKKTEITPNDSLEKITKEVWPITREIIKTNIENKQNLIVEGCYIPFNYKDDFEEEYLKEIKFICLVFSEGCIKKKYKDILSFERVIESRLEDGDSWLTKEMLIEENNYNLKECKNNNLNYILIEDEYNLEEILFTRGREV